MVYLIESDMKTWSDLWDILATRLAQLLGISSGSTVLDVGTGGGSTLLAALKCVGSSGFVTSLDRQEQWANHGAQEIKRLNITNADVRLMDAKSMEFQDNMFDFVLSGFLGWGHCYDFATSKFRSQDLVMKEMHRTLKPRGKLGISTWLLQSDTEWMEHFVEEMGQSARRVYSKETEKDWEIIMEASPFSNYQLIPETIEYTYPTPDVWWNDMIDYGWKRQIEALAEEKEIATEDLKEKAIENLGDHIFKNGVMFTRGVLFILATKGS